MSTDLSLLDRSMTSRSSRWTVGRARYSKRWFVFAPRDWSRDTSHDTHAEAIAYADSQARSDMPTPEQVAGILWDAVQDAMRHEMEARP